MSFAAADGTLANGANQGGSATQLRVRESSSTDVTYLKFSVTGITSRNVMDASLHLAASRWGWPKIRAFRGTSGNWTESNLSSANAPGQDPKPLGSFDTHIDFGTNVIIPLDAVPNKDGEYVFILRGTNGTQVAGFNSREASLSKPLLFVTYE
jgi:hypothetical protein